MTAIAVVAAPAAVGAVLKPRAVVVALMLATTTLLPSRFMGLSFAGIRTDLPELILLLTFAVYVVHLLLGATPRVSRLAVPLLCVGGTAAFGAVVALQRGASRTAVLGPFKAYLFWLLAIPLAGLLGSREALDWLERWIIRVAVGFGVLVMGLAATGRGTPSGDDVEVVTLGITSAAQRLRPALVQLAFLAVLLLAGRVALSGSSPRRITGLVVCVSVIALSFNRSTWLALAICLALLAWFRPGHRDPVGGARRMLIAGAVALTAFVVASTGATGPTAEAMAQRARSVVTPDVLAEKSLEDRTDENASAIAAISSHPVTGIGLGQPYGARRATWSSDVGALVFHDRLFIHNSALAVWLWLGVPGLLAVTAVGVSVVRLTRRARRTLPPELAIRALAGGLCVLGMALQALVQTKLTHRPTLVVVALALTLLDVPEEAA